MPVVASRIGQIARTVSDVKASVNWLQQHLGLQCLFQFEGMAFLSCDGVRLMLTQAESAQPESILYFEVPDLDASIEAFQSAGITILQMPHQIHQHDDGTQEWMAFIEDPDQRPLGLIEKRRPSAATPA